MRAPARKDDCVDRMFLLIPFFPRHADDLVWIRVWAALRCIRTVGKELVTSHALGNGITINRRESRRGCESCTRWMDIRERNRVRNRATRRKRATPFFYPSIRPSIFSFSPFGSPIDYRETCLERANVNREISR